MNKTWILLALLLAISLNVYGIQPIPFLEITEPQNGDTVSGNVLISFHAKGYDLSKPTLTLSGNGWGARVIPECTIGHEVGTGLNEMSCLYNWNSSGHEGEDILIQAGVQERNGNLEDTVKVLVSGEHV